MGKKMIRFLNKFLETAGDESGKGVELGAVWTIKSNCFRIYRKGLQRRRRGEVEIDICFEPDLLIE